MAICVAPLWVLLYKVCAFLRGSIMFLQRFIGFFRSKKQTTLDALASGDFRRDGELSLYVSDLILNNFSRVLQNEDLSTSVGLMYFSEDALGASLRNVELAFICVFRNGCNGDLKTFQVYRDCFLCLDRYLPRDDYLKMQRYDEFVKFSQTEAYKVDLELARQMADLRTEVIAKSVDRGNRYERICNEFQIIFEELATEQVQAKV